MSTFATCGPHGRATIRRCVTAARTDQGAILASQSSSPPGWGRSPLCSPWIARCSPLHSNRWCATVSSAVDRAERRSPVLLMILAGKTVLAAAFPIWKRTQATVNGLLGCGDHDLLRRDLRTVASNGTIAVAATARRTQCDLSGGWELWGVPVREVWFASAWCGRSRSGKRGSIRCCAQRRSSMSSQSTGSRIAAVDNSGNKCCDGCRVGER